MEKNKKAKSVIIIGIILVTISIFAKVMCQDNKNIIQTLSNGDSKTIGWGIKRADNNLQPDVGESNKKLLEENGGICLGKDTEKVIYLTFDEGYEAGYTESILNTLQQNDVKATFFITAHYLNTASDLVERMINEGHIVGNHTSSHPSMPSITDEKIETELMQLHQSVYEKFNYEMQYMRPPKGEFNERTLKKTAELGYKTVMWSFAYCDWDEKKQPSIEEAKKIILNNLHSGEVMLLHPNSKTNSEVLDAIIKEAENQGYVFKLLDQFV